YDGTTAAPAGFSPTYSFAGLVSGDTGASLTDSGAAYDSKDVASASKVTVSGVNITSITGSNGSSAGDYVLDATAKDVAASITRKTVSVTGLAANSKTYDGVADASIANWGAVSTGIGSETLVLGHGLATFADANAGVGKTVTATGYGLSNGSNGGEAGNYQLASTAATATADIAKAPLTVIANNDAKFVTQTDAPGYNGASYSGLVHGETSSVLGGTLSIVRSNSGTELVGTYSGVLQPAGLTAANYNISYVGGDYTIVASSQLLIRVSNLTSTYGSAANYAIASAEYWNGSSAVALSGITPNGNNSFTIDDGAGGQASFTLAPVNAGLSGSGNLRAGSYQLATFGTVTTHSGNFNDTINVVGSQTVIQRGISASASGVSKVYDGSTAMNLTGIGLGGVLVGDAVSASGSGAYSQKNAGTHVGYIVSGLSLAGADAGNYYLTSGSSLAGSDGVITPRALHVSYTGVSKVYDGNTSATVTTADDRIAGDVLALNLSAAYADKNVGSAKPVAVSGVSLGGIDAGNYSVATSGTTTADITRLDSVTWTGGASGNWFDPANWAGGAVPDLANVAHVIIPANVVVAFNTSGALAPAETGAVHIDSLGSSGSLTQSNGSLNIGDGGMTLHAYSQSGGSLTSDGPILLDSFTQTGGSTAANGNFTVNADYSQNGSGSVSVAGNASITDSSGGTTLGNFAVRGNLSVTSTGGDITQAVGSSITVSGATIADAGSSNITLDSPTNNFVGPFNARGNNISVVDGFGGLTLGNISAGGNLDVSSSGGDITQAGGSSITVNGATTVDAGSSNITLDGPDNDFVGPFNASGNNITVVDGAGGLVLGNVSAGGNLDVTSTDGDIRQAAGSTITVGGATTADAGSSNITLDSPTNNFVGPFNAHGNNITGGWRRRAGARQCQRRRQRCNQHRQQSAAGSNHINVDGTKYHADAAAATSHWTARTNNFVGPFQRPRQTTPWWMAQRLVLAMSALAAI
ncbi:MAG: hypothetical protein KF778_14930, partial [Rhodocyclaceae bacterium]|nr:hypothetical protein [Rhodocyclaceae bacterium]